VPPKLQAKLVDKYTQRDPCSDSVTAGVVLQGDVDLHMGLSMESMVLAPHLDGVKPYHGDTEIIAALKIPCGAQYAGQTHQ